MGISTIVVRRPYDIVDVPQSRWFSIVEALESCDRDHVCLVRVAMPEVFAPLLQWTDCDAIWEQPIVMTADSMRFGCIGTERSLHLVETLARLSGTITSVPYQHAECRGYDVLRHLPSREREVLQAAMQQGYYSSSRSTSATALAKTMHSSKSATIEYLRKAEK